MDQKYLKVHPSDNLIVALRDFKSGELVKLENGEEMLLIEDIPMKHKFAAVDFQQGDTLLMYGVMIGKATKPIFRGSRISRENTTHSSGEYQIREGQYHWEAPDFSKFAHLTFNGYHRKDGKVGTMNYWLVIPLVFCENRNIKVLQEAMLQQLGYITESSFSVNTGHLVQLYQQGASPEEILQAQIIQSADEIRAKRTFQHVDGIKFLLHDGGCGGTRQDAAALCNLLAGYIANPNVAGATVLSLGCQNAQFSLLEEALASRDPLRHKPVFILEQQESVSERSFIEEAVKKTFIGLIEANKISRQPAALHHICLGLECGGSDGFSGITANPALGYASDLIVGLGGTTVLAEFPELNGVEQELINRCIDEKTATKFAHLMQTYSNRAQAVGSGFDMNPSPGNIRDGLITDAMKSAGAAKKGGTSPVTDVLDYTEPVTKPGLNLLCTPGNDVESTTALAGSGVNIIVFTTGLGTPTGNPVAPTIKMASNTPLAKRMADIIDINAGTIVSGEDSIISMGEKLLHLIIDTASGNYVPHAVRLSQDDFIPWKRGISL